MEKPFVLLADANEATCTLIAALLQRDFNMEVANNGSEAIERLKSRRYAAVLLDVLLPVADGYAVLDFIASERPELVPRVLVVTAPLSSHDLQRVREYGVCAVVQKPFDIEDLMNAARHCAGGASGPLPAPLLSGGVLLLLADFLRYRWL